MKSCLLWLNLFGDLLNFLVLSLRAQGSLAAENLFLRKQLAFYQERKIKPRRTSHPARLALLRLSRWFDWRSALTVVTSKTFIGWHHGDRIIRFPDHAMTTVFMLTNSLMP
jgi:hypothetical protein